MQNGPYIAERLLPDFAANYCKRAGVDFRSFSADWVLRMAKDEKIRWIVGYKFDVNSSAASEVAQDKVATFSALNDAGIAAAPHYLVRSLPHEPIHANELRQDLDRNEVVAKPLQGTAGRDVMKFQSVDEALHMIQSSEEPAWALSPYLDMQAEYRLIMLDGELLLAYEKSQPTFRGELKLFNLSHGAVAKDLKQGNLLVNLCDLALRVMQIISLRLAAVDIVQLSDGEFAVLEVNDGISMEHYARQSARCKIKAAQVYESILKAMLR